MKMHKCKAPRNMGKFIPDKSNILQTENEMSNSYKEYNISKLLGWYLLPLLEHALQIHSGAFLHPHFHPVLEQPKHEWDLNMNLLLRIKQEEVIAKHKTTNLKALYESHLHLILFYQQMLD